MRKSVVGLTGTQNRAVKACFSSMKSFWHLLVRPAPSAYLSSSKSVKGTTMEIRSPNKRKESTWCGSTWAFDPIAICWAATSCR